MNVLIHKTNIFETDSIHIVSFSYYKSFVSLLLILPFFVRIIISFIYTLYMFNNIFKNNILLNVAVDLCYRRDAFLESLPSFASIIMLVKINTKI